MKKKKIEGLVIMTLDKYEQEKRNHQSKVEKLKKIGEEMYDLIMEIDCYVKGSLSNTEIKSNIYMAGILDILNKVSDKIKSKG